MRIPKEKIDKRERFAFGNCVTRCILCCRSSQSRRNMRLTIRGGHSHDAQCTYHLYQHRLESTYHNIVVVPPSRAIKHETRESRRVGVLARDYPLFLLSLAIPVFLPPLTFHKLYD